MPCQWITLPDGTRVHVRMGSRRPTLCEFCRTKPHTALCDGPRGMASTCDAKICKDCAVHAEPDHDLCPRCVARLGKMQATLPFVNGAPDG